MQLAKRVGYARPVDIRLGSTLHVGHHHQSVGETPAVRRRDRHRPGQTFTVEVLEELGPPREISVAPRAETADREVRAVRGQARPFYGLTLDRFDGKIPLLSLQEDMT